MQKNCSSPPKYSSELLGVVIVYGYPPNDERGGEARGNTHGALEVCVRTENSIYTGIYIFKTKLRLWYT